ncbi:MAG: glycosyltransferase family A protein [Kovacikia sp.]
MSSQHQYDSYPEVAAIVTAMTDAEQPFVRGTMEAVLSDPGIGQVVLCIEESNNWLDTVLGKLTADPRLAIIRLPLAPPGAVRNQALSYVRMPWLVYCDGDDVWCKGKTLIQYTYALTTKCDFVGVDHYLSNEAGKVRAFALARYLPLPSAWMVRTEVMKKYPFDESLYQGECAEWWIRTSGIVSKARCPQTLLRYRLRSSSLSTTTPSKQRKVKIVALADMPVLGVIIFFLTWCAWLITRQKDYIWCKGEGWEQQPSPNTIKL